MIKIIHYMLVVTPPSSEVRASRSEERKSYFERRNPSELRGPCKSRGRFDRMIKNVVTPPSSEVRASEALGHWPGALVGRNPSELRGPCKASAKLWNHSRYGRNPSELRGPCKGIRERSGQGELS